MRFFVQWINNEYLRAQTNKVKILKGHLKNLNGAIKHGL